MAEESKKEVSPEEEIRELELRLEEKKKELAGRGAVAPEKEVLREVIRAHIEKVREAPPTEPALRPAPSLTDDQKKRADELRKKTEREEQVRHLIEIALSRTIYDAVKIAESATPFLLDELHDHLIDDYYDKLIQLRKLKAL